MPCFCQKNSLLLEMFSFYSIFMCSIVLKDNVKPWYFTGLCLHHCMILCSSHCFKCSHLAWCSRERWNNVYRALTIMHLFILLNITVSSANQLNQYSESTMVIHLIFGWLTIRYKLTFECTLERVLEKLNKPFWFH